MNKTNFLQSNFFLLLLCLPFFQTTPAQEGKWEFKKEKSDIKIYTRDREGTNLKELKFTTTINSTMNQAIALLVDVPTYAEWVYGCDHASSLVEETNLRSYCYYKIDFPWPMTDRDLVVFSDVAQDPETKTVTSNTKCSADYRENEKGYIRIQQHFNQWIFKPISSTEIEVTYYLKSNPSGSVPSWLVNMVIDQGPVKTMMAFKIELDKDIYKNQDIPGIQDF